MNFDEPDATQDFQKIIKAITEAGAEVVLIGGLALIVHGGDHVTKDVDLAFSRRKENLARLVAALKPYNPRPFGWEPSLPFVWDETSLGNSSVITLTTEVGRIDLLAEPAGAPPFDKLAGNALQADVYGFPLKIASIEDLIAMKKAAGRPQDQRHIHELEALLKLDQGQDSGQD